MNSTSEYMSSYTPWSSILWRPFCGLSTYGWPKRFIPPSLLTKFEHLSTYFSCFIRSPSAFSRRYIFDSRTRILMTAILIQYLYEYLDRIRTITEMTPCTNPILKTKFWCPYARLKRTERQMRVRRPICGVTWELLLLEYLMKVISNVVWIFCIDE